MTRHRNRAGRPCRANPSAAMSSRLRWHTSSLANMTASRRLVLRGSGALGLALSWAATAATEV